MNYKQHTVQCLSPSGLHRMAFTEWGARDNPRVLVCVHGLTRNARDSMPWLNRCSHYRVICPDVVGRGQSGRLRNPAGYGIPQYMADMVTLIARLNVEACIMGRYLDGRFDRHGAGGPGRHAGSQAGAQRCRPGDYRPVVERIAAYVGVDPTGPASMRPLPTSNR